ncbi:MAG: hypothetical protein LAT67_11955 [Balneolales bacterium]|nr:hypothetical protein [Balneolales bacterium]
MSYVKLKLVTIIAERVLRNQLIEELKETGAKGFTISDASGEGSRGIRASEFEGRNIRIEVISSIDLANKIVDLIQEKYFLHYAVVVYLSDIEVVRGDKYI